MKERPSSGLKGTPLFGGPDVIVICFLVALASRLLDSLAGLWWTFDDAFLLHYAIRHHPLEYLTKPAVWQEFPQKLFTPILPLVYDTDVFFFGVNAHAYYMHHLAEFTLFIVLVYVCLRLWLGRVPAGFAALLVLLGAPSLSWASQLMLRHYVESSIAGLLATIVYVQAVRRNRRFFAVLSGLLYFVAICAKEICVPLPLVLALLPDGTFRDRLRKLWPHFVFLVIYVCWRRYMLGVFFGGYGWEVRSSDYSRLALEFPHKVGVAIAGPDAGLGAAMLALTLGLALLGAFRSRGAAIRGFAGLAGACLPFVPVSTQMELRFAVVAWVAVAIAAASGYEALSRQHRVVANVLLVVILTLAAIVHVQQFDVTYAQAARMSREARFFAKLGKGAVLRNPLVPPAAMGELQWFKETVLHGPGGAAWTYDDLYFCTHTPALVFEDLGDGPTNVSGMTAMHARKLCAATQSSKKLVADFNYANGTLGWTLGPYSEGTYTFLVGDGIQAFVMPQQGGFQLAGVQSLPVRIKYQDRTGEVTYSPVLNLDLRDGMRLHWAR